MSLDSAIALATERIVAPVEGTHRAVARRWFGAVGAVGKPVRTVHDTVSSVVYRSIRFGGAIVGTALDAVLSVEPAMAESVQAIVNGLWGDKLGRHEDRLAIVMGVRDGPGSSTGPGAPVTNGAVTGRLVVLVHGLGETERCWRGTESDHGLAQALEDHPDLTPLLIRYNTGLRVSRNGSRLASLLEAVHSDWPVPVQSIALVGNSMGGLVTRSACVAGRAAGHRWVDDLVDVVTLGSPHRGAALEKLTNVVAWGLKAAPETQPLAAFLNTRSVGIKDLRFGAIVESDWRGRDPDALLFNTVGDHPLPPDVNHHFVAGAVTTDPTNPWGVLVGDLVVRVASGTGAPRSDPTNVVVLGGVRHGDLARQPAVIGRVMDWLAASTR